MDYQLNNPLRPSVRTPRNESSSTPTPPQQAVPAPVPETSAPLKSTSEPAPSSPVQSGKPAPSTPITSTAASRSQSKSATTPTTATPQAKAAIATDPSFTPDVRKALDAMNVPEDLRKLMAQLAQNGLEISGPKKVYVKHSYEIDQDLHQRFHEMYPVLGFKKVKDAINDAIALWCDHHESEFERRNNTKK